MPPSGGNRDAILYSKFDALTDQLSKLNRYYQAQVIEAKRTKIQEGSDKKVAEIQARKAEPFTSRIRGLGGPGQEESERQIRKALSQFQQQPDEGDLGTSASMPPLATRPPGGAPRPERPPPPPEETLKSPWYSEPTPEKKSSASTAPDAEPTSDSQQTRQDMDAMTMMMGGEMLGAEGAPARLRNLAVRSYLTKRSLGWAASGARHVAGGEGAMGGLLSRIPGVAGAAGALGGVFEVAEPFAIPLTLGYEAMKHMTGTLGQYQATGESLGYGGVPGGPSLFGIHNPLGYVGTAAREGAAFHAETEALQGRIPGMGLGGGLTGTQAKATMQTLGQQGFGMAPVSGAQDFAQSIPLVGGLLGGVFSAFSHPHGDAATIAQNLFRPILGQFPGIQAQTLGEFTPTLRYGATSIQQLTDSLSQLGIEAKDARMPVDQFTQQIAQSGDQFMQMGSTFMGGQQTAQNLTAVTGLPPGTANTLAQNPLFQAAAIGQGYLPSQIGDMPGGAFNTAFLTTFQRAQMLTAGYGNMTRSENVPGIGNVTMRNTQGQNDLMAQMLGIPSQYIPYLRRDMPKMQARNQLETWAGKGSFLDQMITQAQAQHGGRLTGKQDRELQDFWKNPQTQQEMHRALGTKEYNAVMGKSGMRDRVKALQGAIGDATNKDPLNQIMNQPKAGQSTVQVQFTGAAAKFFQQVGSGVSPAKAASNAGSSGLTWGQNYSSLANSPAGDVTDGKPLVL